jgi:hypothetical protein
MIDRDGTLKLHQWSGGYVGEVQVKKPLGYLAPQTLFAQFDGLDIMLDYVEKEMPVAKREKSSENGGGDFNAFKSYEEALHVFRKNPQSIVKFDPAQLAIKDDTESGILVDYDVVGDYIDMGRFMEGIPESWGSMHNGNSRNRRANIVINMTQVWMMKVEDIIHRQERVSRLVDALEAGGVRTQVTGIISDRCQHVEVIVKHHHEPLNITDMAVISHPEFLRRILFRVCEYSKTFEYGYGNAIVFDQSVTPTMLIPENNDELCIFVGSNLVSIPKINESFDKLERLLVWEMSKPVPEVQSVKLSENGIYFEANGYRASDEIIREGQEILRRKEE